MEDGRDTIAAGVQLAEGRFGLRCCLCRSANGDFPGTLGGNEQRTASRLCLREQSAQWSATWLSHPISASYAGVPTNSDGLALTLFQ